MRAHIFHQREEVIAPELDVCVEDIADVGEKFVGVDVAEDIRRLQVDEAREKQVGDHFEGFDVSYFGFDQLPKSYLLFLLLIS